MFGFGRCRKAIRIDRALVEQAIAAAELRTSGEIRVSLAPYFWGSTRRAAETAFERLGMTRTRDRNGILFFVVPSRHAFVVLGDSGIHARVGQPFWDSLAAILNEHFRKGAFAEGLIIAIASAGEQLCQYFPRDEQSDVNELPDAIED